MSTTTNFVLGLEEKEAYAVGWDAYELSKAYSSCPYSKYENQTAWRLGWRHAEDFYTPRKGEP